jgi:tetratricopeptide (TPR) repeat protein
MAAKAAWLSTIGILTVGIFSYPLSQPFVLALFVFNLSILAYCNKQVLFTIRNIKLKVTASVILLATFALLCRNVKIFRASLQWQNGYHIVSKNRQKGLEMYAEAYSTLKSYPAFLYNYGYELSMVVRYKKSLPMLQMARKNMYNQDLLLRTGFVQMKLHHYKKAEQNYLQAQYLIPSRLIPRYLLMLLYEDWPKPKESVQMANEIIDFKPKVSSEETLLLKNRAQVYLDSLRQN